MPRDISADLVKRPRSKTNFTDQDLTDLACCINDPLYFMRNFVKIQHVIDGAKLFEPYPFQCRAIEAFHSHRFVITMMGRQLGKALALDTPLPTPIGWTTMGQVAVGDQLIAQDGSATTVTFATEVMHDHDCFEILFHDETIIADAEHLWRVGCCMWDDFDSRRIISTLELFALMGTAQQFGVNIYIDAPQTAIGHPANDFPYIAIDAIRPTASVPVRCIQVDHPEHMFLCGRSLIPTHNTTCASSYLLWRSLFVPDSTILVTANKYVQALEVMDRVRFGYENLPDHIRAGVTEYNKGSIVFDNGSRIVARATSSDAGRGLAVSLLYADEFAYVMPNKQKEFWTSITPTLSTGGSCIITSTPKNDEDQFAQIWKGATNTVDDYGNPLPDGLGRNGFFAIQVPWWDHPDRDETWAKPFRETLGEARFRQEFENCFITDDDTLINPLTLTHLTAKDPIFYTGTIRWYAEPEPNKTYLIALDPSLGTKDDYAAIEMFQLPEMIQIAEWQHNAATPRRQVAVMMEALYALDGILREHPEQHGEPEIYWTFENNTLGEAILTIVEDTGEERFPGSLVTERRLKGLQMKRVRKGLNTTNKAKLSSLARLKSLIESSRMTIHSTNFLRELKNFIAIGNSFRAKVGEHDDLIMATSLVIRMMNIVLHWGITAGDGNLREYIRDDELGGESYEDEPLPFVV